MTIDDLGDIEPWYAEWAKAHLVMFGMYGPADRTATLLSWWKPWAAQLVTEDELQAASRAVLSGKAKLIGLHEHYRALKIAISNQRTADGNLKALEREATNDTKGVCSDCGDTAYVPVPHPRHCDAMSWRVWHYAESGEPIYCHAAVLCRCPAGQKFATRQAAEEANEGKKKGVKTCLTLDKYENTVNGSWRQQIRDVAAQLKAVRDAERAARVIDEDHKALAVPEKKSKPKGKK